MSCQWVGEKSEWLAPGVRKISTLLRERATRERQREKEKLCVFGGVGAGGVRARVLRLLHEVWAGRWERGTAACTCHTTRGSGILFCPLFCVF